MAIHHRSFPHRRKFLKDCGRLAPGCLVPGCLGSALAPQRAMAGSVDTSGQRVAGFQPADAAAPSIRGTCRETLYQDRDSCIYLVELDSGEHTLGLGPANLESVTQWQAPQLVEGNIPSVVCHVDLEPQVRATLESHLAKVD